MFKKVSCWPAKEASGKSSAVAEDLTAKLLSSVEIVSHSDFIWSINLLGKGVFRIKPLNFFPALLK